MGYPLYYPTAPATLQEFASTKLAIDLCRHYDQFGFKFLQNWNNHDYKTKKMLKTILPPRIEKIIDQRIDSVANEISHLMQHFIRFGIFRQNIDEVFSKFDSVVYGPDATIGDELNAKNLLLSDKLTPLEKYKIAIMYCFEEEVRKYWPLVRNQQIEPVFGLIRNEHRLIIEYWNNQMLNSYHEIEYHRGDKVIDWSKWTIWTAFEYFLNKVIPSDEQIRFRFIDEAIQKDNFKNIQYLLPKLNQAEVDWILEKYPHRIIEQLASLERYFDYMMNIWTLVKNSITDDHFSHIIITLCEKSFQCIIRPRRESVEINVDTPTTVKNTSRLRNVLSEIWINAPSKLRSNFATCRAEELFVQLKNHDNEVPLTCYDYGMQFFSQLLADMPAESRDKIWRQYWLVFFTRSHPKNLQHLANLCLKHEDIEEFGETELMNYYKSGPYIEFMLKRRCYDDVIDYINFFPNDRPFVKKFRKQILESSPLMSLLFYTFRTENCSKLGWFENMARFIDNISDNDNHAKTIKNKVFIHASCNGVLASMLAEGWVDDVIRSCELFLLSGDDLLGLKRKLYKPHEYRILQNANKGEFCLSRWKSFYSWADPEKSHLSSFIKSMPIDKVFETKLHRAIENLTVWLGPLTLLRPEPVPSSGRKLEEFEVIDELLAWYFGSEVEARNYKWNVILDFRRKFDLYRVLKAKNECIVNDVLRWFFNGDIIEIGNFKEKMK